MNVYLHTNSIRSSSEGHTQTYVLFYYIRTYVLIQVPDYGKYFFMRRKHYEIRNAENQSYEILKGKDNRTRKSVFF